MSIAASHPKAATPRVRRTDCHGSTAYPPMLLSGLMVLLRMRIGTASPRGVACAARWISLRRTLHRRESGTPARVPLSPFVIRSRRRSVRVVG
ncbi:hypothetical protein GCM10010261_04710 [Streptomyces pilosus]|nr:hypothetical protein GCM10010261_04710 [Streptomyces pilosus]